MLYDIVLESVAPGFHGPVVAALLTLRIPSRTKWTVVAGFRSGTTVGLGLGPEESSRIAASAPVTIVEDVTEEDAAHLKAYLEAGHFPEKQNWPRPEAGRTCCEVAIRPQRQNP